MNLNLAAGETTEADVLAAADPPLQAIAAVAAIMAIAEAVADMAGAGDRDRAAADRQDTAGDQTHADSLRHYAHPDFLRCKNSGWAILYLEFKERESVSISQRL